MYSSSLTQIQETALSLPCWLVMLLCVPYTVIHAICTYTQHKPCRHAIQNTRPYMVHCCVLSDEEEEEDHGAAAGESWVRALFTADYDALTLPERLMALSWLCHLAVDGPTVRAKLELRGEESQRIRKQLWEDAKVSRVQGTFGD